LGWLVLVYCERKTLLAGWFGLAETNKRVVIICMDAQVLFAVGKPFPAF